jgi:hypothetical protein
MSPFPIWETEEIFEALSVTVRLGFFFEGRKLRGIRMVNSISKKEGTK